MSIREVFHSLTVRFTLYKTRGPREVEAYVWRQFVPIGVEDNNPSLEQVKTTVIEETLSWESVPQNRGSREETVCVELSSN